MMFVYCTLVVVVVVLVEVLVDVEVEMLKVVVVESISEEVIPDVEAPPRLEETVEIVPAPVDKEVEVLPVTTVVLSPPPLLELAVIAPVVVELTTSFLVKEITWTSSDDVVSTFDVDVTLAFSDVLTVTEELRDFKLIGEVVI